MSLLGDLAAALPGLHSIVLTLVAVALRCGGEVAIAHHTAAARLLASQLRRLTVGGTITHWTVTTHPSRAYVICFLPLRP